MSTIQGETLHQREQRFNDIVALKKPDRVPLIPLVVHYFPTRIKGISNRDVGYDDELRFSSIKEAVLEFGWDFAPPSGLFSSHGFHAVGTTQLRWPGGDLPDDAPFQFVEGEYLLADEYGEYLANPDRFTLEKIFPRIASDLAGFGQLPLPPLHWINNMYYLLMVGGPLLAAPPIRRALDSLLALSDAAMAALAADTTHAQEMAGLGHPRSWAVAVIPPFDIVSDMMRSLKGSTLDLYRHPEELLATIGLMQEAQIGLAVAGMQASGGTRVFIPMHLGAKGFMSDEQFAKFYWPSFEALVLAIIEAGGTPVPLFEGDYTPRLKYLAELPQGKVAGHFDKVDRQEFKRLLGDKMCFWGNVPASLLCTGTPQQVKDDVRELVELFGDSGTLIVDSTMGIPDESLPENMHALREAVTEYGVY